MMNRSMYNATTEDKTTVEVYQEGIGVDPARPPRKQEIPCGVFPTLQNFDGSLRLPLADFV